MLRIIRNEMRLNEDEDPIRKLDILKALYAYLLSLNLHSVNLININQNQILKKKLTTLNQCCVLNKYSSRSFTINIIKISNHIAELQR